MSESYTGVQKAAILLITLGPEKAAKIFKHLKEDDSIEIINIHGKGYKLITPEAES